MQTKLLLAIPLLALALAGCASPPAEPVEPASDNPSTTPAAPAANATRGAANATRNATQQASQVAPLAPETVHDATYTWTVQAPAAATFSVAKPFARFAVDLTQARPGVGSAEVALVDAEGTEAGKGSVAFAPDGMGQGGFEAPAKAGDWTLQFAGVGVGAVKVTILAS